ncbi:MAG: hypothetical protein J7D60_10070 [Prosthecochloris sp.]|nr:hypothetical protein [Prosthecochloris sp.]
MDIKKLMEEFLELVEWDEEVEYDSEYGQYLYTTRYNIDGQTCDLVIKGQPDEQYLALYLTAPIKVREGKLKDACLLFNYINANFRHSGCLTVDEDYEITFKNILDLEDARVDAPYIVNMLASAGGCLKFHGERIAAVALTPTTFEELRKEYDKDDG